MIDETRTAGRPPGVTEFVELKERTVYADGGVVDEEPHEIRSGRIADQRDLLAKIGRGAGGDAWKLGNDERSRGVVGIQRRYRDIRIVTGPWVDLAAEQPVVKQDREVPRSYVAQVPILAGELLYLRPIADGEEVIAPLPSSVRIWPLTPEAAAQGYMAMGLAARPAQPGELVDVRPLGVYPESADLEPTVGEENPPRMVAFPAVRQEQMAAFASRRHMGSLLTWDDLDALRRAAEIAVANAGGRHAEDLHIADDELVSALRQALGKLTLGRGHGYEAAGS